jgi:hypothetical protein
MMPKMWDKYGNITNDTDKVVMLKADNKEQMYNFIETCEREETTHEIDIDTAEWFTNRPKFFIYSWVYDAFTYVDECIVDALDTIVKEFK